MTARRSTSKIASSLRTILELWESKEVTEPFGRNGAAYENRTHA